MTRRLLIASALMLLLGASAFAGHRVLGVK